MFNQFVFAAIRQNIIDIPSTYHPWSTGETPPLPQKTKPFGLFYHPYCFSSSTWDYPNHNKHYDEWATSISAWPCNRQFNPVQANTLKDLLRKLKCTFFIFQRAAVEFNRIHVVCVKSSAPIVIYFSWCMCGCVSQCVEMLDMVCLCVCHCVRRCWRRQHFVRLLLCELCVCGCHFCQLSLCELRALSFFACSLQLRYCDMS